MYNLDGFIHGCLEAKACKVGQALKEASVEQQRKPGTKALKGGQRRSATNFTRAERTVLGPAHSIYQRREISFT